MPQRQDLSLSTFDDKLIEGLVFCRSVYDLFDQVRAEPAGVAKLRLRPTKTEKRLIEELIPIARYVQARYSEGRRIKVRWSSGSQRYDAILWSSGALVEHRVEPRKLIVEVTTAVHQDEHLVRELGHSSGVKGISRDKKTRAIVSATHVRKDDEPQTDLAGQIVDRIKCKSAKGYSRGTVLIVYCVPNSQIFEPEWRDAVERAAKAEAHLEFREVFLIEPRSSYSATLYGDRKRRRRKSPNVR